MMAKSKRQKKDRLTRAIEAKERSIQKRKQKMANIWNDYETICARIERTIARDQVLLDALRSGALKP